MLQRTEIKKGLLSVKQSQMELLNELREDHRMLKKCSPGQQTIEVDESELQQSQQVRQLMAQVTLLNRENRLLNDDYQKMKKNYFGEKQKAREWELWNDISSRLQLTVVREILEGTPLMDVRMKIEGEIMGYSCELINPKNTFKDIIPILANADARRGYSHSPSNGMAGETNTMDGQKEGLRQQISSLMHTNIANAERADRRLEKVICELEEKERELADRTSEYNALNQKYIGLQAVYHGLLNQHLQADQRASQRIEHRVEQRTSELSAEIQSLKKQCEQQSDELIQKQAAIHAHEDNTATLRKINQETLHRLADMQRSVEANEEQAMSVETKMEARIAKIKKDRAFAIQQRDKTIELQALQLESLREHVEQLNKTVVAVGKDRGREMTGKDSTELRRLLKLNTMVEHLWKVKEVQFENLQEILQLSHM